MDLTEAVKVTTDSPNERVKIDIGETSISMPSADVAQLIVDNLMRRTGPKLQLLTALIDPPPIGSAWLTEGGTYAGIVRGDEGQPDYYLVVAGPDRESINWKDAGEWARGLQLFGDFTLPKRKEQAVLFGNVPELFAKAAYWSSEEYAGDAEYAWSQLFYYGRQFYGHKDTKLRARAVRRVHIE